jgi:hypothetical protein
MTTKDLNTETAAAALSLQRTGAQRFKTLVELERIRLEMRALAVEAFGTVSTEVPAESQEWVYDMRRGRAWAGGGTLRFFTLLAKRADSPETHYASRALGLSLLALLHRALDVLLPEIPEPAPAKAEQPARDPVVRRLRVMRANPAHGSTVSTPRRAA